MVNPLFTVKYNDRHEQRSQAWRFTNMQDVYVMLKPIQGKQIT